MVTAPLPELGEVPHTRLSASQESPVVVANRPEVLPQTPPWSSFNPSSIDAPLTEARQAEQADRALPRQPSDDRQDMQWHQRQQGRHLPMDASYRQHQDLHRVAQINQMRVMVQQNISNTQPSSMPS